jgi:hypothetical protein
MKLPRGKENQIAKYAPERIAQFHMRDNPHGRVCQFCHKVIRWRYRNGVLWDSPRFWCSDDRCQRDRVHKTTVMEEYVVNRPAWGN